MNLSFIEILKVIFLGIVEGITEWLPISSTGHMLLVDEFLQLNASDSFKEMFFIIIQLGAILAVVVLYWNRMFPFQFKDKAKPVIRKDIFSLWFKVVVACIPGAAVTILFDDYIEAHLHTPVVIAIALIFYGVAFILIENWNKTREPKIKTLADISYQTAYDRIVSGSFHHSWNFTFRCNDHRWTDHRCLPCSCCGVHVLPCSSGYARHEPLKTLEIWIRIYRGRACDPGSWNSGCVSCLHCCHPLFDVLYPET